LLYLPSMFMFDCLRDRIAARSVVGNYFFIKYKKETKE